MWEIDPAQKRRKILDSVELRVRNLLPNGNFEEDDLSRYELRTMASSAPSTPRRRFSSREYIDINDELTTGVRNSSSTSPPRRSRLNSKEIPRTYSGLYGVGAPPIPEIGNDDFNSSGGDDVSSPPRVKSSVHHTNHTHHHHTHQNQSNLLPFELTRNRNTDWIAAGGPALLVTYISIILIFLLTFLAYIPEPKLAWAMTNVAHALVSMVYLHWIKGNPADYMDGTQGEMNGMTTWEQIVSKPQTILLNPRQRKRSLRSRVTLAIKKLRSRDVLCVVPTLLAHASCHIAKYRFEYVVINVGVWFIVMLPKMPMMNGVRLLGINRTAGIDDGTDSSCQDDDEEEEDDDDVTEKDLLLLEEDDSKECDDEPKKNR